MRQIFLTILAISSLYSCASKNEVSTRRELQTETIRLFSESAGQIKNCAKKSELITAMKSDRVRVEVMLLTNHEGQVERFQLDSKNYPDEFSNCIFNVVDKIQFPKLHNGEAMEFSQVFFIK